MDCHAHAHLLLDLAFINACDDTFFSALKSRVDQPPNYLKQNTQLLHFERLQNHEFDSQQMANFSQRLNNVESNLQGVKTDLQNVTIDLQGLKDNPRSNLTNRIRWDPCKIRHFPTVGSSRIRLSETIIIH
ncbi:unnamed protein product [Rotaria socialis]|uniref:Uncharacterized protein n=1 Tax=Rotaria socialis TaxID=392032 RepID=A0A821GBR3_9BILA|nr:unnamed protein product [Rotaria socialis]CAF4665347.1 unnamed protein product [Rotaria socialis]